MHRPRQPELSEGISYSAPGQDTNVTNRESPADDQRTVSGGSVPPSQRGLLWITSVGGPLRRWYNGGRRAGLRSTIHKKRRVPVAVLVLAVGWPMTTLAQSADPTFGECEKIVTDEELRTQVADAARASMRAALRAVDYSTLVADSWEAVGFDTRFKQIVEAEIDILRQDRDYLERLLDGNIPSRAEEMAKKTTDAVFSSEAFKTLQQDLQDEIGRRMEPLVAGADLEAQSRATECVRVFLGQRYATSISAAFTHEVRKTEVRPDIKIEGIGTSAAISLAGIVAAILTLVFRRLVQRIVSSIIRRLAGAIAARLAAWISVVVGIAILAFELIAGADGVFPVIRDELTGPETKRLIQSTLVEELSRIAPEQLDPRADEIAADMVVRWRAFKTRHRAILELAEREPRFKQFVTEQPPESFESLSVVVEAIKSMPPGGDEAVLDALDRGLLARALRIPNIVAHTETWTPLGVSVSDLITWHDRAGARLEAALAARLPAHVAPDELTDAALDRLLTIKDHRVAERIVSMREPSRTEAVAVPDDPLLTLAGRFDAEQLSNLFDALRPASDSKTRLAWLQRVAATPALMERLDRAGGAVAGSAEPELALDILVSPPSWWTPDAWAQHADAVIAQRVSPMVLFYRYGWALVALLAVPVVLVLLMLRTLWRWVAGTIRLVGRVVGLFRKRRSDD